MELRHYILIVWKWLWLIVLAAGIAAATSFLWNSRLPKIYQASTSLLVGQSLENPNPNAGDIATSQQLALTYIQIAKTELVLQGVIDALQLPMSVDQLGYNTNASIINGTQLIELRVVDIDPRRAQAIANEFAHQLISQTPSARDAEEDPQREFISKQIVDIQNKIENAQQKIVDLQTSIKTTASAREMADKEQQLVTLQGQINQWQLTYATLRNTLTPRSSNYLSVVEKAKLPSSPIAPNLPQSVLLAASIGMALAMAGVFLIEYFDDTIKSPDDVSQSLELYNLGSIGNIWGENPNEMLIVSKHPRASHSEAYRSLRTNILFVNIDKPMRTLLITSANPREGKSTTAANLAVVMALGGLRVLLVDADMRRPQQHKFFRLSNEFGLAYALLHPEIAMDTYLLHTETENLWVLPAGSIPPNPAELLDSKRMLDLIKQFKERFDLIMFDTPPVLPRVDATIMARNTEGIILVVDAGHSRAEAINRAKTILQHAGGHILGAILNRIEQDSSYYYYYYSDNEKSNSRFLMGMPIRRQFRNVLHRIKIPWGGHLSTTRRTTHNNRFT